MTQTFFADTSFLVAFYNLRDDNHKLARSFIAKFVKGKEPVSFLITDYIFDETLTVCYGGIKSDNSMSDAQRYATPKDISTIGETCYAKIK